jgi:hypothetical protein
MVSNLTVPAVGVVAPPPPTPPSLPAISRSNVQMTTSALLYSFYFFHAGYLYTGASSSFLDWIAKAYFTQFTQGACYLIDPVVHFPYTVS